MLDERIRIQERLWGDRVWSNDTDSTEKLRRKPLRYVGGMKRASREEGPMQ